MGRSQPSALLTSLIEAANQQELSKARAWRKILLIPDRWYPSDVSLIDDPQFFFAKNGRRDPRAELEATITAFFDPIPEHIPKDYQHPQCRFAARYYWLNEQLGFESDQRFPKKNCEIKDDFINFLQYQSVSLVFSNYYIDNPASMFGHSFLRLHRNRSASQNDVALLDDIINFSAFVPDPGSLLYPFKGLLGFYPGRFALLPYYSKIQEYNNFESRDLWEFELNLSEEHIRTLERVMWELGGTYIDYYYLDDNCSFIMLALLEAANPELRLTGELKIYATPSDTLRAVTKNEGMVRDVRYRPSALSKFLTRYSTLAKNEADMVHKLVEAQSNSVGQLIGGCSAACQARVIDTTLDFIDFDEKIVGDKQAVRHADLRHNLLLYRSKIGMSPEPVNGEPLSSRPDLGHESGLLALGAGLHTAKVDLENQDANLYDWRLRWRPALHDLYSLSEGYSPNLQIGFMDTEFRMEQKDSSYPYLNQFSLFHIVSLPEKLPLVSSYAWRLDLGYQRHLAFADSNSKGGRGYLQLGFGKSFFFWRRAVSLYSILHGDVGYHPDGVYLHAGPMILSGLTLKFGSWSALALSSRMARYFSESGVQNSYRNEAQLIAYLHKDSDIRFLFSREQDIYDLSISMLYYF